MCGQSSAGAATKLIFHTMKVMYCTWLFASVNIKPNNDSGNLSGKEIICNATAQYCKIMNENCVFLLGRRNFPFIIT